MGEILLAPMDIDDIDESFYNIVIEIDENIASYLKTLSPGCLLSVSELLSLATKLSCDTCSATFYSRTLLQGHLDTHHRDDDSGSVAASSLSGTGVLGAWDTDTTASTG